MLLIIFLQDVKVDQAECGNISNIEPFYSSLRDGSLTNQQLALFLAVLGSEPSQDPASLSLADVKRQILSWKSANVRELPCCQPSRL